MLRGCPSHPRGFPCQVSSRQEVVFPWAESAKALARNVHDRGKWELSGQWVCFFLPFLGCSKGDEHLPLHKEEEEKQTGEQNTCSPPLACLQSLVDFSMFFTLDLLIAAWLEENRFKNRIRCSRVQDLGILACRFHYCLKQTLPPPTFIHMNRCVVPALKEDGFAPSQRYSHLLSLRIQGWPLMSIYGSSSELTRPW